MKQTGSMQIRVTHPLLSLCTATAQAAAADTRLELETDTNSAEYG